MNPKKFKEANKVLLPPEGSSNVESLQVCIAVDSQKHPVVTSAWEITDEDLAIIKKTRTIYFSCWGLTHPPVSIGSENPIEAGRLKPLSIGGN